MAKLTPVDFDPFAEQAQPKLTEVDFDPFAETPKGEGVTKAALSGVGRGVAGAAGVFGDLQNLSRAAGRALGFEPPAKSIIGDLPTSQDTINAAAQYVPDIKYEPKTRAEKYAATVGEFLPGALVGGGGMVRNAVRYGAVPGVASEALGQATEGTKYEPVARVAGALAGGVVGPTVANTPGKIISPITARPELADAVSLLEKEGVPLTAGQRTGSKALRWAESAAADMPFSAKTAAEIQSEQGQALNRAFTKRMGYEAPLMNDAEWQAARDRLSGPGGKFEELATNNTMKMDQQFLGDVGSALGKYINRVTPANRDPYVTKIVQDLGNIRQGGGKMPGHQYQALRSDVSEAANTAANARDKGALTEIRKALDSAMERSVRPEDKGEWANANREYAAMKALERAGKGAGENAALGYLSPRLVRSEIANKKTAAYLTGKNELGNIAQAAEAAMPQMPNSGTAPRAFYQKMFTPGAGAAIGGVVGNLPGAIAGAAIPVMAGRALMSRPMQAYLGNQMATRLGLLSKPTRERQALGLLNALYGSGLD